jgi:hypothetical protein
MPGRRGSILQWRGPVQPGDDSSAFRFYGELNDFLPFAYRHRRFTCARPATSSVKDAIEALGVPHPEADIILIKRAGQDFSHRLRERGPRGRCTRRFADRRQQPARSAMTRRPR